MKETVFLELEEPNIRRLHQLWRETVNTKGEEDGEQMILHDKLLAHCHQHFPELSRERLQMMVSDYGFRLSTDWDEERTV